MANLRQRRGSIKVRVDGNTQETATLVASTPDGAALEKDYGKVSNPTATPPLVFTSEIIKMMAEISALTDVNMQAAEKKRPKEEEKDIVQQLRPLARLQNAEDFEVFKADILCKNSQYRGGKALMMLLQQMKPSLRKRIQELQHYQRIGLTTPAHIDKFDHNSIRRQLTCTIKLKRKQIYLATIILQNVSHSFVHQAERSGRSSKSRKIINSETWDPCWNGSPDPQTIQADSLLAAPNKPGDPHLGVARIAEGQRGISASRVWDFLLQAGFLKITTVLITPDAFYFLDALFARVHESKLIAPAEHATSWRSATVNSFLSSIETARDAFRMRANLLHLAFRLVVRVRHFMLVRGHKNVQDDQTVPDMMRLALRGRLGSVYGHACAMVRLRIVALEDVLLWGIWYTGSMPFELINPSPHASILAGLTHPLDYVSPGQQSGDDEDGDLPDITSLDSNSLKTGRLSLWLLRICCFAVFGASFFIAIATFKSFVSFSPMKPIALFVIYLIWPILCVATYTILQLVLVFRTLDDRWPLGDIIFKISFYAIAQVLLFAFSVTICDAIKHYLDGLFFFTLCVLLSVMMVYQYWDSITREDLEFSVGSKTAVWEVKDPLLTASATTPSADYEEDASSYHAEAASLVGGVSGTQYYGGKHAYGAQEKFSCSVEMGTELRSFEQFDEGVTAVLAKNGILETFDTKWIVGADGAKGVVRKQLGLTFLGETRDDIRLIMGDIRLHGVGLDRAYSHRFGTFKRGRDWRGWLAICHYLDLTTVAQSEELIFETIASVIPTEITFNKLVWVSEFRANIRMVNKFSEGRVFVAGDAAHPTGGQGLNSSIQDAFNLGWKLALVEKGLTDKSLLETYNTERMPVISEMLEMTTALLDRAVQTGNMHAARSPILFMLGINYRFSHIVLDEFAIPGKPINAYEAGDRAPDAPNLVQVGGGDSDVKTLFGLYRPWYHTMLVFAPSHADAVPILGALEAYDTSVVRSAVVLPSSASVTSVASPADFVFVDQEGHGYSAYLVEAGQTRMFVIRPDGVIGAILLSGVEVKLRPRKSVAKDFNEDVFKKGLTNEKSKTSSTWSCEAGK
ncbi:chitin synthase III catalytic subunit-domain-containing protein [Suillus tomentosus]|nr:chitin synthase III catalytic subunit-domain-containing protein [Suillus tomentosus]